MGRGSARPPRVRLREAAKTFGLCVLAAIGYGVLHDQVTVRLCLEYFTIGHPPIFPAHSPTLLAIFWGVFATWWVGVLLGIPLALAATAGRRPVRTARSIVRPVSILLAVMGVSAAVAAVIGNRLAASGGVILLEPLASRVPADRHVMFITALWAHVASYAVGFVGGLVVVVMVARSRRAARPVEALQSGQWRHSSGRRTR